MRTIRGPSVLSLILAGGLALGPTQLRAQATAAVHGTVTDKVTGRPLEGVSLTVVGTAISAATDAGGRYVISGVPSGSQVIRAAAIGYTRLDATVSLTAGQSLTTDFGMTPTTIQLDEIVVTGTPGATEKRVLGNAVTTMDIAQLAREAPVRTVQDVLQGRSPGVTLTTYSGQAGAASSIRIRGAGSVAAAGNPVFYVDGVRFESQSQNGIGTGNSTVQRTSPLDFLNPDDIQSIEVIKGPAAATLYGADAASGVIQIITKKGQKTGSGVQWTLGGEAGATEWTNAIGNPVNYWLCSPAQIASPGKFPGCAGMDPAAPASDRLLVDNPLRGTALYAGFVPNGSGGLDTLVRRPSCSAGLSAGLAPVAAGCPLRAGPSYKADISARGGGDYFSYYISAERYSLDGVYYNNWERRTGGRGNFDITPSGKLSFNVSTSYVRSDIQMPLQDNASNGVLRNSFRGQAGGPSAPWSPGWRGFSPQLSEGYDNQSHAERTTIGLTTNYKPWAWLTNRLTLGMDKEDRDVTQFYAIDTTGRAPWGAVNATGTIDHYMPATHIWTVDYAGTANAKISEKLSSASSVGLQINDRTQRAIEAYGRGLVANQLNLVSGAAVTTASEDKVKQTSLGVYTQEQVGWRDRLYVTGAVRIDNNSAFGSNFNVVVYPKASVAYVISDEDFFHVPAVDRLKLRAAWGEAGRAPAPFTADRTFTSTETTLNGVTVNELTPQGGSYGNDSLKAETGQELELGFDGGLFNDRVGIEFTYYNQHTKDALIQVPDLRSSGFSGTHYANIGEIANSGIELLLTATPIYKRNFAWDASLSFSTNSNKLVKIGWSDTSTTLDTFGQFATVQKHREGYPLGAYWYNDVNRDASGNPILTNGQVTVDVNNYTYVGPSTPTREGSLTNTFTLFGNLRLYALLDYKGGYYMWCAICSIRHRVDQNTWDINSPNLDRSSGTTPDSVNIKVIESLQTRTWIMPADFLKLRELSVTYTLPASWARMFRANRASVTLAGRNLIRWTKYKGVGDPEVQFTSSDGTFARTDYAATPPLEYLYAAVRITF